MALFASALAVVLRHEGERFTDDPHDPGGPTRWGITLATLRQVRPDAERHDVAGLSREDAEGIYRALWWEPLRLGSVVNQALATKILDVAVNLGRSGGTKLVQRALNALGCGLEVDGVLGPATLEAVNACHPLDVLAELRRVQAEHYRALAARKPEMTRFLRGWLSRAAWPPRATRVA